MTWQQLSKQCRYDEAKSLYLRSLSLREKIQGLVDPDSAETLLNLGNFYYTIGDNTQAEHYAQRVLALSEQKLGSPPFTVSSLFLIASLYHRRRGQYERPNPLSSGSIHP